MQERTIGREIDEKPDGYLWYVEYANPPVDSGHLKNKLESLGFNIGFQFNDPDNPQRGYNMKVNGKDVEALLYPKVAIMEIPKKNRIIGPGGILNLSESDNHLLNAIKEEYTDFLDKEDETDERIQNFKQSLRWGNIMYSLPGGQVIRHPPLFWYIFFVLVDAQENCWK